MAKRKKTGTRSGKSSPVKKTRTRKASTKTGKATTRKSSSSSEASAPAATVAPPMQPPPVQQQPQQLQPPPVTPAPAYGVPPQQHAAQVAPQPLGGTDAHPTSAPAPALPAPRQELPAELPYHSAPLTAPIRDFVESPVDPHVEPVPVVRSDRPPRPIPLQDPENLTQAQMYETLAALFVPYARRMESEWHPKIGYCLKARNEMNGRESHFCAVQTEDDGVVFHLFPLYGHPELLESLSPALASRKGTQTSFFFTEINAAVVAELAHLTHLCSECFVADGMG